MKNIIIILLVISTILVAVIYKGCLYIKNYKYEVCIEETKSKYTTCIDDGVTSAPTFSIDGKSILYVINDIEGDKLIKYDIESNSKTIILNYIGKDIKWPSFANNENLVLFASTNNNVCNLYLFNVITKKVRQITNEINNIISPAISPDGTRIVFLKHIGDTKYELSIMNIYDKTIKKVYSNEGLFNAPKEPKWSYDSKEIVFILGYGTSIVILNNNGNAIKEIRPNNINGKDYIVFCGNPNYLLLSGESISKYQYTDSIYVIDREKEGWTYLKKSRGFTEKELAVSIDGRYIAYRK